MVPRCIEPARSPVDSELRATPSKSATHRALVAAALAEGDSEIREPLDAEDTRRTLDGLRGLGVVVETKAECWLVRGTAGVLVGGGAIDLGASGTSARFLTALAALGQRPTLVDGCKRLRERPMAELVDALEALGATIESTEGRRLPIRAGGGGVRGGAIELSGARSSQFASALLLAAPAFAQGLRLIVGPPRVSFSYVELTVAILEEFGANIGRPAEFAFSVSPQRLRAGTLVVEGDHSSASYLLAAVAILGGRIRIHGLDPASRQPDARFLRDLASLGCRVASGAEGVVLEASGKLPAFSWDLSDAPDLAPTAAVLALFADGPCTLSGLGHLAFKESNRTAVIAANLTRLGSHVALDDGTMSIEPLPRGGRRDAAVVAASDHRIAMAFAVAGLACPGVTIDDSETVAKSYPRFWEDFECVRTGSSARD